MSAVPVAAALPLIVPDNMAFRVRFCEFRWRVLVNADQDMLAGISRIAEEGAFASGAVLDLSTNLIASVGQSVEASGTAGLMVGQTVVRRELWDYDYRFVMRPTAHMMVVGDLGITVTFVIGGQFVRSTQNERNAIIANQGGAKS